MKAKDKYASSYTPAQVRAREAGVPKHIHYRGGDRHIDVETSWQNARGVVCTMVYFDEIGVVQPDNLQTMPASTRRRLSRYERKQAKVAALRAKKEAMQLAARYRNTVGDAW